MKLVVSGAGAAGWACTRALKDLGLGNNVLAFPGIFRGALDARASCINDEMKGAAAQAIAEIVTDSELSPDYVVPSVFNQSVATEVAHAVSRAARTTHVARRIPKGVDIYR